MFYYEKLYIVNYKYMRIVKFSSCEKINEHGYASVTVEVDDKTAKVIEEWHELEPITICDKTSNHNLLAGVLLTSNGFWEKSSYLIELQLVSGTYLLDRKKRFYSYQTKQSYSSLIEQVLTNKEKFCFYVSDRTVPGLLVQYGESDWEFVKRLSSHFDNCIVSETNIDNLLC